MDIQKEREAFEVGRLKDQIANLLDERQELYAQINSDDGPVALWAKPKNDLSESVKQSLKEVS